MDKPVMPVNFCLELRSLLLADLLLFDGKKDNWKIFFLNYDFLSGHFIKKMIILEQTYDVMM